MKIVLLLLLATSSWAYLTCLLRFGDDRIPGQYFVGLKEDSDFDTAVLAMEALGCNVIRKFENMGLFVIDAPEQRIEEVQHLGMVEYVEEDSIVRAQDVTWGLDRIDQTDLPLDNKFNPLGYGLGAHIYVIDSGINPTHKDFSGRASIAYDAIRGGTGIDCNGHGTHCAGTSAGYFYGVAVKAYVYGVRVLNCFGHGRKSDLVEGIKWVAENHVTPAVASVPIASIRSCSIDRAVRRLYKAGVFVSVAAGNYNLDACRYSPANSRYVITVAATNSNDRRSSFSNWGSCVDIFAPGSSITSAWHTSDKDTKTKHGTSLACSHVAGAAAVLLGNGVSLDNVKRSLIKDATPDKIKNARNSPNRMLYIGK